MAAVKEAAMVDERARRFRRERAAKGAKEKNASGVSASL